MENDITQIKGFLDKDGRLISLPAKHKKNLSHCGILQRKSKQAKSIPKRKLTIC